MAIIKPRNTPLQPDVNFIIRILLALVFFFGTLILINHYLHDVPPLDSVREASVLFGLAPSSLFLMIVVAYAVGAVRTGMASSAFFLLSLRMCPYVILRMNPGYRID